MVVMVVVVAKNHSRANITASHHRILECMHDSAL